MGTARQEFTRFLGWLATRTTATDADAIKVANIVSENFGTILPTSSNRAQRSVTLAPLLQRQFAGAATTLAHFDAPEQEINIAWTRLHSLVLGPFRGFRYAESFEFDKRVVLFYGPNGTGKTSLCEAIEFGLVRSVNEAESKRIAPNEYFMNIHARGHAADLFHRQLPHSTLSQIGGTTEQAVSKANTGASWCYYQPTLHRPRHSTLWWRAAQGGGSRIVGYINNSLSRSQYSPLD